MSKSLFYQFNSAIDLNYRHHFNKHGDKHNAFSEGIPIAFVYTESTQSNAMVCAYTNFSVDTSRVQTVVAEEKTAAAVEDLAEVTDDGDLPF